MFNLYAIKTLHISNTYCCISHGDCLVNANTTYILLSFLSQTSRTNHFACIHMLSSCSSILLYIPSLMRPSSFTCYASKPPVICLRCQSFQFQFNKTKLYLICAFFEVWCNVEVISLLQSMLWSAYSWIESTVKDVPQISTTKNANTQIET